MLHFPLPNESIVKRLVSINLQYKVVQFSLTYIATFDAMILKMKEADINISPSKNGIFPHQCHCKIL